MNLLGCQPYNKCDFGYKRLTRRAVSIAECLLGFLTGIAAQLLRMTYLNRNSPSTPAVVLSQVQIDVLLALTPSQLKQPEHLTVDGAIRTMARLGGYLEHRRKTAIGIQVLWRGWLQLESLCQGWQLDQNHN